MSKKRYSISDELTARPSVIFWLVVILGVLGLLATCSEQSKVMSNVSDVSTEETKKSPFLQLFSGEE
ncbi:MAG: hypothetical protein WCV56_01215 [Candidatus Omnitrophota bacterium]